jgi:uncharacterized protein (DUF2141 family)
MKYILPTIILLIFIAGCARQVSPTGGPKDTIPPKLITANPANNQTNFAGKNVTLEFSETINLNSAKEQVIITPSIGKDYEIKSKNKIVVVDLNTELDSNTTYTINFREAVQDITERNPVRDLKLAFSTGSYVDSLSIAGKVTDLISTKELKDITVALQHVWADTMSIVKHPSFYFTRSNEKGEFKLENIKPGEYQLYAYQDKNKNLIVDTRNENYAFFSEPLQLNRDTTGVQLRLIRLDVRPLKLTSARPYNTYFNLKTTKNLKTYNITSAENKDIISYYGEDHANIRVYNTYPDVDSLQIKFTATDSSGSTIDTLLYAKFRKEENIDKEKFTMAVEESSITARTGTIRIKYKFNKPVASFNLDSIYYKKDSLTIIRFQPGEVNWDPTQNTFTIEKRVDKQIFLIPEIDPERPNAKIKDTISVAVKPINELSTKKAAFISIESDTSMATTTKITADQPATLSEILYDVRTKKRNILIQLLNREFKVLRQTSTTLKGSFTDLPAGDYIVRYIIDENNNQAWDSGNYLQKKEPEKIFYSTDPKGAIVQTLKANWELELAPMLITD